MLTRFSRILMNEADSSPGNGAPAEPAAPAAPTAAPTAPVDLDAIVTKLSAVVDEKLAAHKNATFAELRKAGAFKQDKPADPAPAAQSTPSAPVAAQAGLSIADVEALLERKGIVASRAAKHGLSESQLKRFESAMAGVSRESLASEADAYLADMGLAKAPTAAPAPPAAAPTQASPAKPNISDRGTAAPTDTRDSEGVLNSRPLEMTPHDIDALILKHGPDKGMQMFQERVLAALGNVRIRPPSGGRR
jgi:hypothetical protein